MRAVPRAGGTRLSRPGGTGLRCRRRAGWRRPRRRIPTSGGPRPSHRSTDPRRRWARRRRVGIPHRHAASWGDSATRRRRAAVDGCDRAAADATDAATHGRAPSCRGACRPGAHARPVGDARTRLDDHSWRRAARSFDRPLPSWLARPSKRNSPTVGCTARRPADPRRQHDDRPIQHVKPRTSSATPPPLPNSNRFSASWRRAT